MIVVVVHVDIYIDDDIDNLISDCIDNLFCGNPIAIIWVEKR